MLEIGWTWRAETEVQARGLGRIGEDIREERREDEETMKNQTSR